MNICVIGAGYVGLVTGACLAKAGHKVNCYDIDQEKINLLCKGIVPFYEPGLEELVMDTLSSETIEFTSDLSLAIEDCPMVIVTVGTPCRENGEADISQIIAVAKDIAGLLTSYKVILIKSTVPVGTCRCIENVIRQNMKNYCKIDVVSNPEFLREGSAIRDMLYADRIVIGSDSQEAIKVIKEAYIPFGRLIFETSRESAELIKYASNAFLATKISFINEMANFCEKVGADIKDVAKGMGFDPRIGSQFLSAGIGFGGSCFPKDLKALIKTGKKFGCNFKIIKETLNVNEIQKTIPIQKLRNILGNLDGKTITLWGLSFKPNTDDIRDAPSLDIVRSLLHEGAAVKVFDPIALDKVKEIFPQVMSAKNCYDAVSGSHAVILVTEWEEFKNVDFMEVKSLMAEPVIVDGRNVLDARLLKEMGFVYVGIGQK